LYELSIAIEDETFTEWLSILQACGRLRKLHLKCHLSAAQEDNLPTLLLLPDSIMELGIENAMILSDDQVLMVLCRHPRLKSLGLKWCGLISDALLHVLPSTCPLLEEVGVEYTRVSVSGILDFVQRRTSSLQRVVVEERHYAHLRWYTSHLPHPHGLAVLRLVVSGNKIACEDNHIFGVSI